MFQRICCQFPLYVVATLEWTTISLPNNGAGSVATRRADEDDPNTAFFGAKADTSVLANSKPNAIFAELDINIFSRYFTLCFGIYLSL